MIGEVAYAPARVRPLRVAVAGFGVVGSSVAKILCEREELADTLHLTHVFNRHIADKKQQAERLRQLATNTNSNDHVLG